MDSSCSSLFSSSNPTFETTYVFGVRLKPLIQFLGCNFVEVNVQLLFQVL